MASVSISNIMKSYGPTAILHGVSVDIADGEFVILVGPSGCGKSTLLRMIAGLEDISGGEVRIDGRVVNDDAPKNRDIAMVFQNYALYPHMTVRQNMEFAMKLKGASKADIEARVTRAADILGLTALLGRHPKHLSGGQRQRVAMGRAIVRDPKVFLFDEPLSNLDAKLRVQMRTEIKALHQRLKTTTIYVTHDQIEAMTMADKIVVMRDGVIEQIGAPLELYDHPANLFVAQFIGSPSMNIINGVVAGNTFKTADGIALQLPEGHSAGAAPAIYGIRPEHMILAGPENGIAVTVEVIEPTGSDTQVFARLGGQSVVAVMRDRMTAKPGETIYLAPDLSRVHLFDEATGHALIGKHAAA